MTAVVVDSPVLMGSGMGQKGLREVNRIASKWQSYI
jgi:hypothetical protein